MFSISVFLLPNLYADFIFYESNCKEKYPNDYNPENQLLNFGLTAKINRARLGYN